MNPESRPIRLRGRSFSLVELLVVMVIIGLLAGFVGPRFFAQIGKSEAGLNWIGYVMHHAPAPMLVVVSPSTVTAPSKL